MNKLDEQEIRERRFLEHGFTCVVCGESVYKYGTPQLAHKIANTKANRTKLGKPIIDHPLNRVPVCSLKCNDACNIGNNPGKCKELVEEIIERSR